MTEHESHHPAAPRAVLRQRAPGEHSRVSFFELFFDLVFVFAVTQLSHSLAEHLDLEGALQTLFLLLTIWWAWMYTTWATNWLDPDHFSVRLMLIACMLASLIMSAAIPEAFDGRGLTFAVPYVGLQVGRTLFLVRAFRDDELRRRNFWRIGIWFIATAPLWIAGAIAEGDARVVLWVIALGIEYLGPPAGFWVPGTGRSSTSDWNVEGAHMAERCGLFIIIALGESLLITGATFSGLEWTTALVAGMAASFGAAVAMWWIYFDATAELGSERIAHSEDPGRLARLAYTYIHLPMVAGIILVAVGDEFVLANPGGPTAFRVAFVILGGPALFLFGHLLFKRAIFGRWVLPHVAGIGILAACLVAYEAASPAAFSIAATASLMVVVVWAWAAHREGIEAH